MRRTRLIGFVIVLATFVGASVSLRGQSALAPVTDVDAYAVYAAVLPRVWAARSKDPLLLQRETEVVDFKMWGRCFSSRVEPGWPAVVSTFIEANSHGAKQLQPKLPLSDVYFFISRGDLTADDARLALKYPGPWLSRPESIDYAAVSIVGFDDAKEKAIVYARTRLGGALHFLVASDGAWVPARFRIGCGIWGT